MTNPTLKKGDTGPDVERVQKTLGIPVDGDFGGVTDSAVRSFQAATGLDADGIVGPGTWAELNGLDARMAAGSNGLESSLQDDIIAVVSRSPLLDYQWSDRGLAPRGYIAGMALSFALAVLAWMNDALEDGNAVADAVEEMARAATNNDDIDVLAWYADEFDDIDMDNSIDGLATLRHLFVLLIGLGMRESSGEYCCGLDQSADNTASDTAEAGLFQTSWNIETSSPHIGNLLAEYWDDPNGWLPVFSDGISPTSVDLQHYGDGEGARYQWLAKYSPTFAVFVTAVGLRKRRQHWGPINRREVELVKDADDMLMAVQRLLTGRYRPERKELA
jgi:hypothetical protein